MSLQEPENAAEIVGIIKQELLAETGLSCNQGFGSVYSYILTAESMYTKM